MDKEQLDLEKFVELFDTAMNSDNPTVKKCLNNLLLVVAIAHAEDVCDNTDGPLRGLVKRVDELERKLVNLEYLQHRIFVNANNPPPSPPSPPWNYSYNTGGFGNGYVEPNSGPYSINNIHLTATQ